MPRGKWYQVGAMRPFQRELLQKSPRLSVDIGVCFCTIPCRNDLLSWSAHSFAGEEDLLYVMSHNPMRHLDWVDVKELPGKASQVKPCLSFCRHVSICRPTYKVLTTCRIIWESPGALFFLWQILVAGFRICRVACFTRLCSFFLTLTKTA